MLDPKRLSIYNIALMQSIDFKNESKKFYTIAKELDELIRFAEKAKEAAEEQGDQLDSLANCESEIQDCDPEDTEGLEELKTELARAMRELADPCRASSSSARFNKPSLETLLSLCKDFGNFESFKSPIIEIARQKDDADRQKF
jgi:hypothetical protein